MFTIASVSAVIPSNRNHCKITSGGMIVVFGAYTLALVILRPYNNFRTQVLQTTVAGAQTFACCVGLLAVIYPKERYALTNAAQVVGLLAAMVNLSEAVLALTVIFLKRKRSQEGGGRSSMMWHEMQEVRRGHVRDGGDDDERSPRGSPQGSKRGYEAPPPPPPPLMNRHESSEVFTPATTQPRNNKIDENMEATFPPTSEDADHASHVDWKKVYHMLSKHYNSY